MRKYHYEWISVSEQTFWFPKGVHDYLCKGGINLDYMKMRRHTGRKKLMTIEQRLKANKMEG